MSTTTTTPRSSMTSASATHTAATASVMAAKAAASSAAAGVRGYSMWAGAGGLAAARLAATASGAAATTAARRAESTLVSAGDIREGDLIEEEGGKLWRVMTRAFSRTAMGRAYVQAELRSLEGVKRDVRYRTEDTLAKASLDTPARYTVLYGTGDALACMHTTTFEQVELPTTLLGDGARYAQEGMTLVVESYKGVPAIVAIPPRVSVLVKHMDEGGGTATVDTAVGREGAGAAISAVFKVRVPKFIKVGDVLTLDTADGKYLGRE